MSAADNGGPAFPCTEANYSSAQWTAEGISVRDYFAAKSLAALITTTASWHDLGLMPANGLDAMAQEARFAYQFADAMLAARKVTP